MYQWLLRKEFFFSRKTKYIYAAWMTGHESLMVTLIDKELFLLDQTPSPNQHAQKNGRSKRPPVIVGLTSETFCYKLKMTH